MKRPSRNSIFLAVTCLAAGVAAVEVNARIREYIVRLIEATRDPALHRMPDLAPLLEYGASPRASVFMARAAQAYAFIHGRAYVLPDDVKAIAPDVLRHRVLTTYEAEAEEVTSDDVVQKILASIESP